MPRRGGGGPRAWYVKSHHDVTPESSDPMTLISVGTLSEDPRIKSGAILHFVDYDWDDEKAESNLEKHGVSFEEAATIFDDPLYVDFYDPDHSVDEHRYLIMGQSTAGRLLIVAYTERDDVVRLISAREVTSAERKVYEEG